MIGLALSIYLELQVSISKSVPASASAHLNCTITYEGLGAEEVPLIADQNLVTQCALYVLRCHGQHEFPPGTNVHIINPIPLGRGLGSSGAAVVAGIILGTVVGGVNLPKERILDYCLMIERHPDNVAAALYGGFVGTYLRELNPEDMARIEIPLSEVLPAPAGGVDTGLTPPEPPTGIGHYIQFRWAPEVKAIAIIPDFEVKTADARSVLPTQYSRSDVVGGAHPNVKYMLRGVSDIQYAAYRVIDNSSRPISTRPWADLRSDERQSPPTFQEVSNSRTYQSPGYSIAKVPSWLTWHLSLWRWPDHLGTCDH